MSSPIERNLGSRSVKAIFVSAVAVVSVIVVAFVYRVYLMPSIGPEVSVSSYPLKLAIRLDRTEFAVGENVSMFFTLTNLSNDSVVVTYPDMIGDSGSPFPREVREGANPFMVFAYKVSDENGTKVFWISEHKAQWPAQWSFTLNPLEEVNQTVTWNQNLGNPSFQNIPPGTYSIRGNIPPGGYLQINWGPRITIETPTITFIVK
jgi:hypothetical protein